MEKLEILWQEICFFLSQKSLSIKEDIYEQKILIVLEKMGWSHFNSEIILKKSIQLGSTRRIIPDIIVKPIAHKPSFVIEVKRPSVAIETDSFKNQLFSYMRQLKLSYGLLIGNKIMIYYDGELNKQDTPILLETIMIDKKNSKGLDFIRLFSKEFISKIALENYAKLKISQNILHDNKNQLLTFLLSSKFNETLLIAIKKELSQKWDEKIIDAVFDEISIDISKKQISQKNTEIITTNEQCKEITKSNALSTINNFLTKNITNNQNLVFSNQNKANDKWWLEPKINFFESQSFIALYKYSTQIIYLFMIPANEFISIEKHFHIREDSNRIHIIIDGEDTVNFRDISSGGLGVSFNKYLIEKIPYVIEENHK